MGFAELSWEAWFTLGTILLMLIGLGGTRIPPDFIFLGALGALLVSGVLETAQALNGFSSSGMITVGVLYIVVAGLKETGGLNWIGNGLLGRPKNAKRGLLRLMLPVTGLSAFLNNTPVVAMFIPVVGSWCRKMKFSPSHFLIPLSFASIFGGLCTLIGTSTNLVLNGLYQDRFGHGGLSFFEVSKIGVPCAVVGFIFVFLFARRLLPERKPASAVFENPREYTLELTVTAGGSFDGKSIESAGLRNLSNCFLAELVRKGEVKSAVPPDFVLQGGDHLIFVGMIDSVKELRDLNGLEPAAEILFDLKGSDQERCLVEVVVSNTCPLLGKSIRDGNFRKHYNAVVIAVARNGERVHGKIGDIVLRPGDTLLVESHAGFIPRQRDSHDFLLVGQVEDSLPIRHKKGPLAIGILVLMVLLASTSVLSMLKASVLAALLMIASGCCSMGAARKSIEWQVLLVIGSALGIASAMATTGLAECLAQGLIALAPGKPLASLALVYLGTVLFTLLITNNAAAALIFPVAMETAGSLGVSYMPFLMTIMMAASASFITPMGYQTNLMVYGPGGYKFTDYGRLGIPLTVLMALITIVLTPIIWPF
ncbi:SLC13 family permease [Pontiella agarivorans]|uniref:SLC13 family permease n=1 Tax=Pontiella agarivorans TaxID=3038953 RepID=A0ABU5MSY4_9BACT|nr:SLC13 family permease [Pontiella agarivorans]MDZ8117309.1 SLC13 family permease [Pontiella agarivorans]